MTRPVFFFFVIMALAFPVSTAFMLPSPQGHPIVTPFVGSTATARLLHPDQAKELEECAYDLLKQAMEEDAEAALMPSTQAYEETKAHGKQRTGPWAWCMEHLSRRGWLAATNNSSTDEGLKP